jgi:predicted GNAT family acetyltransferase
MSNDAVVRNDAKNRFEVQADGHVAFLNYRLHGNEMVLVHTQVPAEMEGRGIGGHLAKAALDSARQQNLKVSAPCPFVAGYIQRHPEYSDLLQSA